MVITIIGLLSVGGFTQTQSYLAKGRDSQRQKGLAEYFSAVNTYQLDNVYFPGNENDEDSSIQSLETDEYISKMLLDPKDGVQSNLELTYGFRYNVGESDEDDTVGASFELSTSFEAKQMQSKWHDNDEVRVASDEEKIYERSSLNEEEPIETQPDDFIIEAVE